MCQLFKTPTIHCTLYQIQNTIKTFRKTAPFSLRKSALVKTYNKILIVNEKESGRRGIPGHSMAPLPLYVIHACVFCFKDTVMWFSSGGSKSFLHMDTVDNINCMISGVKEWFIVDLVNKYLIFNVNKLFD